MTHRPHHEEYVSPAREAEERRTIKCETQAEAEAKAAAFARDAVETIMNEGGPHDAHVEAIKAATAGVKFDGGKLKTELLAPEALLALAADMGDGPLAFSVFYLAQWWARAKSKPDALFLGSSLTNVVHALTHMGETPGLEPVHGLELVTKVLEFGARKYAERNWEKGLAHSRTYAAAVRHLLAHLRGEELDPETGYPHLAHYACEIMFAHAFTVRGRDDLDDRPFAPEAPKS